MAINPRLWGRKLHRWGAVLVALPFLLVLATGLLLQVKKEVPWVQPPTQKGVGREPSLTLTAILEAARTVPEAQVQTWKDIDRLDLRPKDGVVKVRCQNGYEVQIDTQTGDVLQVAYRRSDMIEALHDGSYFDDAAKLYIFLPAALVVLGLWITGMYLFFVPLGVKWRRWRQGP